STVAAPAPVAAPAAEEPPVLTDAIDAPAEHQPEMAAANAPDAARAANVEASEDDLPHQTQTTRPLAAAKPVDDISNSMAEALFGDADLDMLSAALASAGWSDTDNDVDGVVENLADTASDDSATMETPRGKYASFGASSDGELQLLDDAPAQADGRARKVASTH
ncbi:MAG TPA: hypothetical protein VI565_06295, partial [Burkholderiales bacterium]|nr:hypothetical protein [Burkholderiales bacterium]